MRAMPILDTLAQNRMRFAVIYSIPVVAVLVASVIHRPHILFAVPLLVCFFVALLLVRAVKQNVVLDNLGVTMKANAPLKFRVRLLLWSLAYCFASFFPLGFAIQEASR